MSAHSASERCKTSDPRLRFGLLWHSTFGQALCGAVLLWAAGPPLDLWPLAWIAPAWWVLLARREKLPGRRPYRALWLVGFLFWLAAYHFVRLPHPAAAAGWIALAAYLGFYLPVFVGLTRIAVHRLRAPLILAAPVVWTGLELARAHLLTGITMGALGHSQHRWIALVQVSDLAGGYTVDFLVMLVAACLARTWPCDGRRWTAWAPAPAVALVAAALVYGHVRLSQATPPRRTIRVALIQGASDAEWKADDAKAQRIQDDYERLSKKALRRWPDADLVVWPETMFRQPLVDCDLSAPVPAEWADDPQEYRDRVAETVRRERAGMIDLVRRLGVPTLLGVDTLYYDSPNTFRRYNSAVLITPDGQLHGRYDKMHRVLFGEYVPLGKCFPRLQRLTPLPVNLDPGQGPVAMDVGGVRLAPNICYETVIPHVIRRQVRTLRAARREPDVLVNLTNDGWFRGSSELDMHLVCAVFRAIECRKPIVIAANTGFSAQIDADGRIVQQGPRREEGVLLAMVGPDARRSLYLTIGDVPAGFCLLACLALATVPFARRLIPARSASGDTY